MFRIRSLFLLCIMLLTLMPAAAQTTANGPFDLLADLNPGTGDSTMYAVPLAGGALLPGTPAHFSNGTPAGTAPVSGLKGLCSSEAETITFAGQTYFCGVDPANGYKLWRSDGTTTGTRLAFDLPTGSEVSNPIRFTLFQNALFFQASGALWRYTGSGTPQIIARFSYATSPLVAMGGNLYLLAENALWRVDSTGSAATLVTPISSRIGTRMVAVGNRLFFTAQTPSAFDYDNELWVSDGTAQGTTMLVNVVPQNTTSEVQTAIAGGPYPSPIIRLIEPFGNKVIFEASGGYNPGNYGLWVSDGTVAGTQLLVAQAINSQLKFNQNNTAFYVTSYNGLWYSDGTLDGTVQLLNSSVLSVALVGQTLYAGTDVGLYRSDGTVAGTLRLVEGRNSVFALGNNILFTKAISNTEVELWRTDGVVGDAQKLADLGTYSWPFTFGEKLFFSGYDPTYGEELWFSDGSVAGTAMLLDLNPGPDNGLTTGPGLVPLGNGRFIFIGNDGVHGSELFGSDGTAAGTRLLLDANTTPASGRPSGLQTIGDKLFFLAQPKTGGALQVHSAQGTTINALAGLRDGRFTAQFQSYLGPAAAITGVLGERYLALIGERSYSGETISGPFYNGSLWSSDGTPAGAQLLFRSPSYGETIPWLAFTSEQAFFATTHSSISQEAKLYATEGTSATTQLLGTFGAIGAQVVFDNTLYFVAWNNQQYQLWRSDGTVAGTSLVQALVDGEYPYPIYSRMIAVGDVFYLLENAVQSRLWRSDGTTAGTTVVPNIHPASIYGGEQLFFSQWEENGTLTLWTLDANQNASRLQGELTYIEGEPLGRNQQLFFVNVNAEQIALRVANAATNSIQTLYTTSVYSPGQEASAKMSILDEVAGSLLFTLRNHPAAGLYRTDGTPTGTYLLQTGLNVSEAAEANGKLYLSASEPTHGHEFWALAPGTTLVAPAQVEQQPGGTVTLELGLISGLQPPTLSAADPVTVSVKLDPALSYVPDGSDPQPTVEGNSLHYSLPAGGPLSRSTITVQLSLPADAPTGSRYSIEVQSANQRRSIAIVAAYRVYAPMIIQ
jgi:ELWxxDGT repeat protein